MFKEANTKARFRQLRDLALLRTTFPNLVENAVRILVGRNCTHLSFLSGLEIYSPENYPLIAVASEIFAKHIYNTNCFSIGPNDVVVDIGANIGMFSLFAAAKAKAVFSFEPFPESVKYLKQSAQTSRLSNVTARAVAVSDSVASQRLYLGGSSIGHSLFDRSVMGIRTDYVEVQTTTLKNIMDEFDLERINFLKMDCEGAEGAVLLSTPRNYIRRIDRIAMEFHDNVSKLSHDKIELLLREMGFVTRLKWDGTSPFGFIFAQTQ